MKFFGYYFILGILFLNVYKCINIIIFLMWMFIKIKGLKCGGFLMIM